MISILCVCIRRFVSVNIVKSRRGIRKALKKTEKQEEQEDEVDLMFADVDESESPMDLDRLAVERFTPVCTPSRNRKDLLGE